MAKLSPARSHHFRSTWNGVSSVGLASAGNAAGILVMPITNDAGRNIGGENALAGLAAGTGGRVFTPSVGPTLDSAFAEILRDLRTQYLLGYYPRNVPPSRNRFHRLEVKLRRPDLRALARTGYYGESEAVSGRQE